MKPELSALLDGELESREARAIIAEIEEDESLRVGWRDYQLIGDALRGKGGLSVDITDRVMARLQAEPVVLAPRALAPNDGRRSLMALAAALAAVVGWLALAPQERDALPPAPVARAEQPAPPAKMAADVANNAAAGEMREYLAAHQAYAAGLQFQGGAQHIRTVSMALAR
jgi:sigma-E factor negative regulatory protein RseA